MNSLNQKLVAGLAAALSVFLAVGWFSYLQERDFLSASHQLNQHQLILDKLQAILLDISEAKGGRRSFTLTGRKNFLNTYQASLFSVNEKVKDIRKGSQVGTGQQAKLEQLSFLLSKELDSLNQTASAPTKKSRARAAPGTTKPNGMKALEKIHRLVIGLQIEESGLVEQKTKDMER